MPRAKSVVPGKARKKKALSANKGAFHGRRKLLRSAKENLLRGMQYAYRDRRQRKRVMRQLWILRINAASRRYGLSYNRLIQGLRLANIEIDRKNLSDLAIHDLDGFGRIVEQARAKLDGDGAVTTARQGGGTPSARRNEGTTAAREGGHV